jgi:hypothetical protein
MRLNEPEYEDARSRVEACALRLVNELEHLRDEITGILPIQVVYQPDWPLLEHPFWWRPPFMDFAPHTVAVGVEDEFWVVLQWLEMPAGPVFLPVLLAKSRTGEWAHSMQDDHDIYLQPSYGAFILQVDKLVDGHLLVVLAHTDKSQTLPEMLDTPLTPLYSLGWLGDPQHDLKNLWSLYHP